MVSSARFPLGGIFLLRKAAQHRLVHGGIERSTLLAEILSRSLVPYYLADLPKTASGQDFGYDPRTGAVYDPAQAFQAQPMRGQPARRGGGVPTAGVGPMGEAMTGVGMQNQLNSMSNSGTSSAGGYARQSLGNSTGQHQQQQQKVLDELGF